MKRSPNNPRSVFNWSAFTPALAAIALGSAIIVPATQSSAQAQESKSFSDRALEADANLLQTIDTLKKVSTECTDGSGRKIKPAIDPKTGTVSCAGGAGIGHRPSSDEVAGYFASFCVSRLDLLRVAFNDFKIDYLAGRAERAFSEFQHGMKKALEINNGLDDGETTVMEIALKTGIRTLSESSKLLDGYCEAKATGIDDLGDDDSLSVADLAPASPEKCVKAGGTWYVGLDESGSRGSAAVKADVVLSLMKDVIEKAVEVDKVLTNFWATYRHGLCEGGKECSKDDKEHELRRAEAVNKFAKFALELIRWSQHRSAYYPNEGTVPEDSYEFYLKMVHVVVSEASKALSLDAFNSAFGCNFEMLHRISEKTEACPWMDKDDSQDDPYRPGCVTYAFQRYQGDGLHSMDPRTAQARTFENRLTANKVWADLNGTGKDEAHIVGILETIEAQDLSKISCGGPKNGKPFRK